MARTLKLTLSYDGTEFDGWQLQPTGRTVQGVLETALFKLTGQPLRPIAAGRTDAGVHAEAQVLSLDLPDGNTLPCKAFHHGLNALLPPDVAVLEALEVAPGFNARKAARGKHYRYRVLNRRTRHPLQRRTHYVVFQPLALAQMQAAAERLVGEHDFAAFRAADCQCRTTVRKLHRLSIVDLGRGDLVFEVEGTAFLKHMVRNLVGTLVHVGRGKLSPDDVDRILAGRDRTKAGPTAPPHGLTLVEVRYESTGG
jgi:tRNA pseudouridine38-40 synthase